MQIFLKKSAGDGGTITFQVPQDITVEQFYAKIKEKVGDRFHDFYCQYGTKNLDEGPKKKLTQFGVGEGSTLFLLCRLKGGKLPEVPERNPDDVTLADVMLEEKSGLRPLKDWVTLSKEDCGILNLEPGPEEWHAKMPCGHVISPQAMTAQALSLVREGHYSFFCPMQKIESTGSAEGKQICQSPWPYDVVKHVGRFTPAEMRAIEGHLAANYLRDTVGMQECPKCESYCIRKDKKNPRVICTVCSMEGPMYEFCWYCKHDWTGSGTTDCGNTECGGVDEMQRILQTCTKKKIYGVECPSVRACPGCRVLINHWKDCKHMVCSVCKKEFCFVCLSEPVNGSFQCGSYRAACTPAPVQDLSI